jgi:hypothetical protein
LTGKEEITHCQKMRKLSKMQKPIKKLWGFSPPANYTAPLVGEVSANFSV